MKTASSSATPSCPCGEARPGRLRLCGRLAALAMLAAGFAVAGCLVVPVPLPGIKSGRAVNEATAHEIAVGTSKAEVLLRLGEPDSVSIDGRIFAYRFSRTWGAVFWAIGGAGAAQGGAEPLQYGEAIVIAFDDQARVALAERRAGNWADPRPGDEPLFYDADFLEHLRLGGEPVQGQRRLVWWVGPRPVDTAAAHRPIGLPPWTESATGMLRLSAPGNLFVTASALWLRPSFATGTADTDVLRLPRDAIEAIVPFERGTPRELTLLLTSDHRTLAVQDPPISGRRDGPTLVTWLESHGPLHVEPAADVPVEGWVVWVSIKTVPRKPRAPVYFSCLWLTAAGLRLEHFDVSGRPAGHEFLDWSMIASVEPGTKNRTILGVQIASADITCRDGRTLCLVQPAAWLADRERFFKTLRAAFARAEPEAGGAPRAAAPAGST